jgi:RND superfamily putative drug exporter
MFDLLGRLVVTHPRKICLGWLALVLLLALVAPAWQTKAQDDDIRFLPERCPSVRGYRLLEKAFPQDVFASKAVYALERRDRRLTKADFALVDRLTAELEKLRDREPGLGIGSVYSYRDLAIGSRLTSADGRCTLIQMALASPFLAEQTRAAVDRAEARLRQTLAHAGPGRPVLLTTGTAGIGRDLTRACADSLEGTTWATVALVVVTLLLVYRAPLLALVPLLTIAVSAAVALKTLALLTMVPGVHLVNVSKVFAIVMLFGAGTDYCLFLLSRYREELHAGRPSPEALRRSIARVGGALAASAGTVMCGLGLMVSAEFAKVRYAGPAIALGLGVTLLASLTLTPALVHLLGAAVFWPGGVPGPGSRPATGPGAADFWNRVSRRVVARPVLVWAVAVLVLLPLALLGLRVEADYRPAGELPPGSESLRGLAAIQRHFTAGETGPITVLLSSPTDWGSRAGRDTIEHLCRCFAHLGNVAEVRSLTQPLGKPLPRADAPPAGRALFGGLFRVVQPGLELALAGAQAAARRYYVASVPGEEGPRSVTRLDVVLRSDPFDAASLATLRLIRTFLRSELPHCVLPRGGVKAEVYGVTANARDLAAVTGADRVRVNILVLAGIFLILWWLVRRPGLAAYLLATVLFSYFVALGATALAGALWSGRPLLTMDWRVPFFLFIILVAVGEDYNILLVTRALQEKSRHGTGKGISRALARTGGTITSCGFIMAGTFATLMLAGLGTLKQVGFALAFGVLVDTFVVRPFLVPAFILVVWRLRGEPKAKPAAAWPQPAVRPALRRAV